MATAQLYTLSLHDALPILRKIVRGLMSLALVLGTAGLVMSASAPALAVQTTQDRLVSTIPANWTPSAVDGSVQSRSEEHTSELQSHVNLVCRLLLEKKKTY